MAALLVLDDIELDVVRKDIKHVHLSVHPPTGRVRIAAPEGTSQETLRAFAISKLPWIRRQQTALTAQEREAPRLCIDRESHYLWGIRYLMEIEESDTAPMVKLSHRTLCLRVRPDTDEEGKRELLASWYRAQIRQEVPQLIEKWEKVLGVVCDKVIVRRMKTMWGSCTPSSRTIRLNTELAKKPPECLEYIIVHELAHLIEPTHNDRFVGILDRVLPRWRDSRDRLNELPVRHESWRY